MKDHFLKKFLLSPLSIVTIGFVISVIVKFLLVADFEGPIILEDEFEYKQNAWHIFAGIPGFFIYYIPPLYPLFLSISFFFDNFYLVMKFENVIITSLAIYPCYLLLKLYIPEYKASFYSLIILLLPIHFSMNQLILSENLFFPLFVLFLYLLVITLNSFSVKLSFLTGFVLGLLLLTRYFGVALAPAIVILYSYVILVKKDKKVRFQVIKSLLIIAIVSAIIYIPWVMYAYSKITSKVNDFFVASQSELRPISHSYTIIVWFIRYTLYLALMTGPFFGILMLNGVRLFFRNEDDRFRNLYLIAISISISFLCLAAYQLRSTDIFNRYINGRYITYLNVPWLLIAGISIARPNLNKLKAERALLIGCLVLSFAIIYFAYLVNIKGIPWKVSPNYISSFNFMEGFLFVKHSRTVLIYFLFLNVLILYLQTKEKSKFLYFILPYFLFCSLPHLKALNVFINQPFLASYKLFKSKIDGPFPIKIYYTTRYPIHHLIVKNYFPFFNADQEKYQLTQVDDIYKVRDSGYIVTDTKVSHISPKLLIGSLYVYFSPIPEDKSIVYSFADGFDSKVIKSQVQTMDTPWINSVSRLENRMIFAAPESYLTFNVNLPNRSNLKLKVFAAYHPLARNWHVSDGTRMRIVLESANLHKTIIFDQLIHENDEFPFEYSLQKFKGRSVQISLITSNDKNSNILGDWSVWIDPVVVESE